MSTPKVVHEHTSWSAWRETLAGLPTDASVDPRACHEWAFGLNTVGSVLPLADAGWPEGLKSVQALAAPALRAVTLGMRTRGEPEANVTGASLDVGALLSGVPECWVTRRRRKVAPVVTLDINLSTSGGIPAEVLVRRGAGVVALVQALQGSGYTVRVHAVSGGTFSTPKGTVESWTRVRLTDDGGGPLDMDRLSFALVHPAATRTLVYCAEGAAAGVAPSDLKSIRCIGWPEGGRDAAPPAEWKSDLYLPGIYLTEADWSSPASVEAWVAKTCERLTAGEAPPPL